MQTNDVKTKRVHNLIIVDETSGQMLSQIYTPYSTLSASFVTDFAANIQLFADIGKKKHKRNAFAKTKLPPESQQMTFGR